MLETGPVYRLAAGPRNFVIIGEPQAAKHVLRNYGTKYHKGLVAEVSEFLFGSGFAIAEAELWQVRNSLHFWSLLFECTLQLSPSDQRSRGDIELVMGQKNPELVHPVQLVRVELAPFPPPPKEPEKG